MKDNVKYNFTIEDIIKKYKNNYWSKSDDSYLLSNVDSIEYSIIAIILNKSYDDVIYRIIKKYCIKNISMIILIKNIEVVKLIEY